MSESSIEHNLPNETEEQPPLHVADDSALALIRRNFTKAIKFHLFDEMPEDSRVGRVSGLSSAEAHAMLRPRPSLPVERVRNIGKSLGALSTQIAHHERHEDDH